MEQLRARTQELRDANQTTDLERRCVKNIFERFVLDIGEPPVISKGDGFRDFSWFNKTYPRFPFKLSAVNAAHVGKLTLQKIFTTNSLDLNVVSQYWDIAEGMEYDLSRDPLLVCFQGAISKKAGVLAMYNLSTLLPYVDTERVRLQWHIGNVTLTLEPMTTFLEAIGKGWC